MGFGSFAGGLSKGINNGMEIANQMQRSELEKERLGFEKEDREFRKEDREYTRKQRDRETAYQDDVSKLISSRLGGQDAPGAPVQSGAEPVDSVVFQKDAPSFDAPKTSGFGAMQMPKEASMPGMNSREVMPAQKPMQPDAAPGKPVNVREALFSNTSLYGDPKFMDDMAKIAAKHGKAQEMIPWLERSYKAQKEGTIDALKLIASGNDDAGLEAFNKAGKMRADSIQRNEDGTVTVKGEGQDLTFNPKTALESFLDPAKYLDLQHQKRNDARQDKKDEFDQTQKTEELSIKKRNAAREDRESGAKMGLYGAQAEYYRAKGDGVGAGAGLTKAQTRANEAIEGARQRVANAKVLSANDPRLQSKDEFGVPNPKFDRQLYQDVELAQKTLYGDDAASADFNAGKNPAASTAYAEYVERHDAAIKSGRPDLAKKYTERARSMGILK